MKLEGDIGELNLIERLVELGRERFTGAVRFENDGIIKIIYFKGGDVLSASTNDRVTTSGSWWLMSWPAGMAAGLPTEPQNR